MARPLGENQAFALRCLEDHNGGAWYPGAGWEWTNRSTTIRLLDSLVKRGLATREERTRKVGSGAHTRDESYPYYQITEAGREERAKGPLALRRLLQF